MSTGEKMGYGALGAAGVGAGAGLAGGIGAYFFGKGDKEQE